MNKSFTLIEILVVIVVIGVLSAFILVGLGSITNSANIAKGKTFANSLRNSLLINLVSEWKFDDGSGTQVTTKDYWSTRDGALTNFNFDTTDGWRSGDNCVSGSCLQFDGTNDYVQVADNDVFDLNPSGTVGFWVKFDSYGSGTVMYSFVAKGAWYGWDTDGWCFYQYQGYIGLGFRNGATNQKVGFVQPSTLSVWHYIVGTWDPTITMVYMDGILKNSDNIAPIVPAINTNAVQMGVTATYYFDGSLDDVKIYNAIAPAHEIQQNYYSGLNRLLKNNGIASIEFNQRLVELKSNIANNE